MTPHELELVSLTLWREARGQATEAKEAVVWSIRNRVNHPTWWGVGWVGVVTHPLQYSSMTFKGDPNTVKYPQEGSQDWLDCLATVTKVTNEPQFSDPTNGAVSYFDKSLDSNPPSWSKQAIHCVDVGAFHFYKF